MWTPRHVASEPVNKAGLSPFSANSEFRLVVGFQAMIPVVHTLYDYNKGIS